MVLGGSGQQRAQPVMDGWERGHRRARWGLGVLYLAGTVAATGAYVVAEGLLLRVAAAVVAVMCLAMFQAWASGATWVRASGERESGRRTDDVVELSPAPTCILDLRQSRIIQAGSRFCELLGRGLGDLQGRSMLELVPDWSRARVEGSLRELLESGVLEVRDMPWTRSDGSLVWADACARSLECTDGPIALVTLSDITERRSLQDDLAWRSEGLRIANHELKGNLSRLAESEARHRALFTQAMDAVILVDSHDGRIRDANPKATELVGAARDEIVGRPIGIFDHAGSASLEHLVRQTGEQTGVSLFEIPFARRDGTTIYVDLTGSEVSYGEQSLVQFVLRDVTDRRRLREALESTNLQLEEQREELELVNARLKHASNMKSRFLASMSHEIRTPLNAIIGFAELLADESWGELNDQQRGFVTRIIDAGQHLLQLLNDIIDLSKVEAGTIELETGPVAVNELVEQAAKVIKGTARSASVSIVTVPDESRPVAMADERRVKQVLFNLLSNAVRYSPEGSSVRVIVRSEGDWVTVSVVDEGSGIPEADQERVFEEFVTLGGSGQNPAGAGLGLPLSRNLVHMHGGELELESKEGEGTTFRFTLPVARNPEEDGGVRPETPP